jgi:hypothetical protein
VKEKGMSAEKAGVCVEKVVFKIPESTRVLNVGRWGGEVFIPFTPKNRFYFFYMNAKKQLDAAAMNGIHARLYRNWSYSHAIIVCITWEKGCEPCLKSVNFQP